MMEGIYVYDVMWGKSLQSKKHEMQRAQGSKTSYFRNEKSC